MLVDKHYAYNDRNQLTGITDALDADNNVTYQYDANGNQVIKSKNGSVTSFVYDARDKLLSVRQDATTLGRFHYDYAGMRLIKVGEAGEVRYTYDGASVLLQHDDAGATLAKYDYGPDVLLSLDHATEGRQFYHFDALGSVVNLTRPDAALQARYQYDAWGNTRANAGHSWNRFGFTGHEQDGETGLYYFKARFYDPDTGRFLSQDPYLGETGTPPSLHRYLYAYANPTVYVDPDGRWAIAVPLGEAAWLALAGTAAAVGIQGTADTIQQNSAPSIPSQTQIATFAMGHLLQSMLGLEAPQGLSSTVSPNNGVDSGLVVESPTRPEGAVDSVYQGSPATTATSMGTPGHQADPRASAPSSTATSVEQGGRQAPVYLSEGAGDGVGVPNSASEASSAVNSIRLRNQLTSQEIAGGHAFDKHVLGVENPLGNEFAGLEIRTRQQFADHIESVVNNPTHFGELRAGRSYFYDQGSNTIVIRNPSAADGGTAFRIDTNRYPNPLDYLKTLR